MKVRLLLVEDDDAIAQPLQDGLTEEGHEVERARTAAAALAAMPADLVLVDLGLPDRDGTELVAELRSQSDVGIVVLTARSDESDKVAALNGGADDYVVKPFGLNELLARINAVMRRSTLRPPLQQLGALEIDRRSHSVRVGGVDVGCTPKEYDLLERLAWDPGALVTRQQLLDSVWSPHWFGTTKMIDVHVASLRRKVGEAVQVETVRGIGFRLLPPQ